MPRSSKRAMLSSSARQILFPRDGEERSEERLRADAFVKASVPVSSSSVEQLATAYPGVVRGVGVVADDFSNEPKFEELPDDESDLPF